MKDLFGCLGWISRFFFVDTPSASEDEGSLRRKAALSAVLAQTLQSPDYWINRSVQSSSTSSSASSTLSHGEPKSQPQPQPQPGVSLLADVLAHTNIGKLYWWRPQLVELPRSFVLSLMGLFYIYHQKTACPQTWRPPHHRIEDPEWTFPRQLGAWVVDRVAPACWILLMV